MKRRLIQAAERCFEDDLPEGAAWWGSAYITTSREQYNACMGFIEDGFTPIWAAQGASTEESVWFLLLCAEAV